MTITTSSRFTQVEISGSFYAYSGWDGVSVILDDDDSTRFNFVVSELGAPRGGDFSLLAVMGEILEADGEFRDADGNTVEIQVLGIEPIATYQQFVDAGYPSPFIDYPNAFYQRGRVGLDAGRLTTRAVNDNGQISHVEEMSKIPGLTSPTGDTMTVSLTDWTTRIYTSTEWQIVYDYVEEDDVTLDNRHEKTEWKALLAYLESIRTSGDTVPQDLDTSASGYDSDNPLPGRVFTFTPTDGTAQTFTVTRFSWTLAGAASWLTELICHCAPGTGSTYNQADYAGFLQTQEVTIGSISNSLTPVWGSLNVPLRAKALELPNGQAIVVRDEMLSMRRRDGLEIPLLGEAGLSVDTSQLTPHPLAAADWWMADPTITSIHHTLSTGGDKTIRLWDPTDKLRAGVTVRQTIHNRQPAQHGPKIHVQDWDGNLLFTLRPTQRAEIQSSHGTDGVGEVVVTSIPTRLHYRGGATIGNLGVNKIDWSTTHYAIPLPTGGDGVTDDDAFDLGTVVYVDGVAWSAVQHERLPGSVVPLHDGQISFDLEIELAAPISGIISAGWETELRGSRAGNTYAVNGTTRYQQSYGGLGTRRLIHVAWRGICRGGDIYTPIARWTKSSTMNMAQVQIVNYQMAVQLEPLIESDTT